MVHLKRVVLDVLKPHTPNALDFTTAISEKVPGVPNQVDCHGNGWKKPKPSSSLLRGNRCNSTSSPRSLVLLEGLFTALTRLKWTMDFQGVKRLSDSVRDCATHLASQNYRFPSHCSSVLYRQWL